MSDNKPSHAQHVINEYAMWAGVHRDRKAQVLALLIDDLAQWARQNHIAMVMPGQPAPPVQTENDLDREIAANAALFEIELGRNPDRRRSEAYPWGWCYVSDEVQKQFRAFCAAYREKQRQAVAAEMEKRQNAMLHLVAQAKR